MRYPKLLLRTLTIAAASPRPPPFSSGRAALLERPVPTPGATSPPPDTALWSTGAFSGEVYPDLPVAASWRGLLRAATGGLLDTHIDATTGASPCIVRTVGAQMRGRAAVRARMAAAAGVDAAGRPVDGATRPHALLLLSGGHPGRAVWAPTTSLDMLAEASAMREDGLLPRDVALWAVANPLLEPPSRAAAKVEAGASVLLTQPPLAWGAWAGWWRGVEEAGVPARAAIVAGVALPPTPSALRFWVALAGAGGVAGVSDAVAAFDAAAAAGRGATHARVSAAETLARLAALPGLAGVHVMPVTKGGREVAADLVASGALAPWGRVEE